VTEEAWSWWQAGSIHRAPWPQSNELREAVDGADPAVLEVVSAVLVEARKAKTAQRRSQRAEVARLVVEDSRERLQALRVGESDLRRAGTIRDLVLLEAGTRAVTVELAPEEEPGT
jgi:valyl-tRNA synthetase